MAEPTKVQIELAGYVWAAPTALDAAQLIADARAEERAAVKMLTGAAKEAREAMAACLRFVYQLGAANDFCDYLESQGIKDGFGVRIQDAIAHVEAYMEAPDATTPVDG